MPRAKTLDEVKEKIAKIEVEIRQGENQVKRLLQRNHQQERKDRTRRLIERGAITESLISGAAELTNEQIKTVLQNALSMKSIQDMIITFRRENQSATAPEATQTIRSLAE